MLEFNAEELLGELNAHELEFLDKENPLDDLKETIERITNKLGSLSFDELMQRAKRASVVEGRELPMNSYLYFNMLFKFIENAVHNMEIKNG